MFPASDQTYLLPLITLLLLLNFITEVYLITTEYFLDIMDALHGPLLSSDNVGRHFGAGRYFDAIFWQKYLKSWFNFKNYPPYRKWGKA